MGFVVGQPVGAGAKNQLKGQFTTAPSVPTGSVVGKPIDVGGINVNVMLGV